MPNPDEDSHEYAQYKAQRRTGRAAKGSDERSSRPDSNSLSVETRKGGNRSSSRHRRHRSSSRVGNSDTDGSGTEGNSELSRRSHRKASSRAESPGRRKSSNSPTKESGSELRAPSPKGKGSGSDVSSRSFGGMPFGALQSAAFGLSQPPPGQQPFLPHSQSTPVAPGYGGGQSSGVYAGYSTVSPSYGPNHPGTYGGGAQVQQALSPSSLSMYAQGNSYTASPPGSYGVNPLPPPGAPYSAGPSPSQGVYYPSGLPPPQHEDSYLSSGLGPAPSGFNPGQGQAALQSTAPSVFQFQTDGPKLGGTSNAPYGGDPTPPPKLDPNHPGLLPGEGAGKMYPPGQAPQQYNNPDYYVPVLSDTSTSQSLHHSIQVASGVSASGIPAKPSYLDNGTGKPSSGGGLSGKLGKLATTLGIPPLGGSNSGASGGYKPPPSPALQPYYGTYQSISPMPSPTFGPSSPLFSPSGTITPGTHQAHGSFSLGLPAYPQPSQNQGLGFHSRPSYPGESASPSYAPSFRPGGKSPSFKPIGGNSPNLPPSRLSSPSPEPPYDASADAAKILAGLKHTFTRPSAQPLIEILPTLTPSQLKALRSKYKASYHGVNLAKHLKSVFTTSTPFGKIAFAVALGPYESEAWFANSWYQKKKTRNELLIESLMGKSNKETAHIKTCFRDAKYNASLEKAVSDELPADKFRLAVMTQLSCSRMEEDCPIDETTLREDVARLGTILERGASGGETEMVGIIVNRSDRWLRELAGLYRQVYERDLAKAIMGHSKNLAGETLLHVLNGAVNKPLRDAKLLDQAITAVLEEDREDLLISRATRIHWDPKHLRKVKRVFKKKYHVDVGTRIIEIGAKGSYREFLLRMLRD